MGSIKAMIKTAFLLVALIFGVLLLVSHFGSQKGPEENEVAKNSSSRTPPSECTDGEATGVEYGISGSNINVRKGPGTNYEKITNQKATSILGNTTYIQVDNTVTVLEICRKGDWSFIQVIRPDWLKDSHKGWIASRFLRKQMRDAAGVQTFTEEDFIWDKITSPYKGIIVAGVNKIHRENSRCKEIDPSSAYLSGSKSSPGKPVFYVTCGSGAAAFNVWFSKDDLDSKKTFEAAKHIDKATAISLCEQYARSAATYPSTVDFSNVMDLAISEHPNGRTTVNSTFTAKNSFNLEIKFKIRCLLDATGLIEAAVHEAG